MSALRPDSNEAHDLGTSSIKWGTLHVSDVQAATLTTSGNVEVQGNLTVTGTQTSLQVSNLNVEDPLIKLARENSGDAIDIGFYGQYNDGATKYAGLIRDANDSGKFKLLDEITSEPSSTVTGGSAATLVANVEGALTGNASTATTLATARNVGITAGPIRAANVSFDGSGNVALTSSIADDQLTNDMLANPGYSFGDGTTPATIELGAALVFQGTANELEVSRSSGTYTFGLPSAVSGLSSVSATSLVGALTGNASSATALETARNVGITSGPVRAANVSFDGTGAVALTSTIADDQITNAMLANPGIELKLAGSSQETIELGGSIDIAGTSNEIDVAYSTGDNKYTFSLPSTISAAVNGNSSTASALASAVNVGITSGPVRAANVSFDGSGAVALTSTIADDQITNDMLANPSLGFGDGGTPANHELGKAVTIQGTSNEVECSVSHGAGGPTFTIGLPSTITAALSGNASTASALNTAQNIGITAGPVRAANISFDGSGAVGLTSSIADDQITNAMLANPGIELKLAGSSQETIELGSFIDIAGTSNEIDVAYSTGDNKYTFSLPSTISAAVNGNASTATALASGQNIGITSGPVRAANISFDGSGAVALTSTIADEAITNDMLANDAITFAGGSGSTALQLGDTFTINGTSDEIETAVSGDAITIGLPNDITIGNDLDVGGDIQTTGNVVVGGNLTAAAATVTLGDTLLELGVNNTSAKDHGFYSQRADNSFCGFFFDETDDKFKVFTHDTEPSNDVVAVSGNFAKGNLDVGAVEVTSLDSSGLVAGELRMEGSAPSSGSDTGTAGDMRFDSANLYVCVATNTWKSVGLTGL